MVQEGGDLKGKLNGVSRGCHSCPCGHHAVQSASGWRARLQFSSRTAGGAGPSAVAGGLPGPLRAGGQTAVCGFYLWLHGSHNVSCQTSSASCSPGKMIG